MSETIVQFRGRIARSSYSCGSIAQSQGIVAVGVVLVGRRRIAVDQRAQIHRVRRAAHLVLDTEQHLVAVEIDDVLEAVLILVVLDRDEIARLQLLVGPGEVRDVHLHVMTVERRLRRVGLAELHVLVLAHLHARERAVAVLHLRGRAHDRRIERRDRFRAADRHVEFDVGDAERDAPEALGVRLVAAHAIAPRTGRLDIIIVLAEAEFRPLELAAYPREPVEQRVAAGDHQPGMPAHDLRRTGRQMELAAPDIDPHVGVGDHQVRIARQPEPDRVEQLRQMRVRHLHVDVLHMDRIAEVFAGAVEGLVHGAVPDLIGTSLAHSPERQATPPRCSSWHGFRPGIHRSM